MPVHYGSQVEEHHAVRSNAGCFDVSHMAILDIDQDPGEKLLLRTLTGDVSKLQTGQALYSLMLNFLGGILDDLIVYKREHGYRLVVNAGTTAKDIQWLHQHEWEVGYPSLTKHRNDLCIVAVQGPNAISHVSNVLDLDDLSDLEKFTFLERDDLFIARTGYTGEDGVEVMCSSDTARQLWSDLVSVGVAPAGLGARDSLRLEAGLNLYGHDMTEDTNPYESRLGWTVDWDMVGRPFMGRQALEHIRQNGTESKLVGLKLTERGVPREGFKVTSDAGEGIVTSGTFSPTLKCGIALARVPRTMHGNCEVQIRKRAIPAKITRLPFV